MKDLLEGTVRQQLSLHEHTYCHTVQPFTVPELPHLQELRSITDIHGTPYKFTPFPCFSQCMKIGFPANHLLFHKYQISGRYSVMKPAQVMLL